MEEVATSRLAVGMRDGDCSRFLGYVSFYFLGAALA